MTSRHTRVPCPSCGRPMLAGSRLCRSCTIAAKKQAAQDNLPRRFEKFVDQSGECWEWNGARTDSGYGIFQVGDKAVPAHRMAFTLAYGPLPVGAIVCHRCDNPPCVRPDHLFAGSHSDNRIDCQIKNRWKRKHIENVRRGERNNKSKLTEQAVRDIRQALANGIPQAEIAAGHGVKQAAISSIKNGETWKHVDGGPTQYPTRPQSSTKYRLTADDVRGIKRDLATSMSQQKIASKYGVHQMTISDIKTGKTWKDVE